MLVMGKSWVPNISILMVNVGKKRVSLGSTSLYVDFLSIVESHNPTNGRVFDL